MDLSVLLSQLSIRTKRGRVERLHPNWAQRQMLRVVQQQRREGRPVRIIVLKARQTGVSTLTEGLMFWNAFINPYSFGLVLAHLTDSSEAIFNMTRRYWETWPFKDLYTAKYHSKRELAWEDPVGSAIRIATASSRTSGGRGLTVNFLHASEVAFWDNPGELMGGLRQTIPEDPTSWIILESTANGIGNWWHQTWQEAELGQTDFAPVFIPWWKHPEYTASWAGLDVPLIDKLDDEERFLVAKHKVTEDRLLWRRWAIANLTHGDLELFHQEYPSTSEEAFISTGLPAFDLKRLRDAWQEEQGARGLLRPDRTGRIEFVHDPRGPLTIFRTPSSDRDWGRYYVGGDPMHAGGRDFACAQVINRRVFEQAAVWHGKIDPVTFGDELVKLARFYNDAELAPEVEGPGYATVGRIVSLEYPHVYRQTAADKIPGKLSQMLGWSTNWKRKDWMVAHLAKLILDGSLLLHDRRTYEQLRSYVTLPPPQQYGNADPDGHDDTVSALGIACICSAYGTGAVMPYQAPGPQAEEMPEWSTWLQQDVNH